MRAERQENNPEHILMKVIVIAAKSRRGVIVKTFMTNRIAFLNPAREAVLCSWIFDLGNQ